MSTTRAVIFGGIALALVLAAFVSPFASAHPDGLESVADKHGIAAAEQPAWTSAILPDYAMPGVGNASVATGLAGAAGVLVMLAAGWALARLIRRPRA